MEMAKVTSKGQITIPVSIRRRLGIEEGDKLLFIDRPNGVLIVNPDIMQSGEAGSLSEDGFNAPSQDQEFRRGPGAPVRSAADGSVSTGKDMADKNATRGDGRNFDVDSMLDEIRSFRSKF